REGTWLPARGLLRRPGAGRGHALHRDPRPGAVEVRLVAVRGHDLPFADRRDLGQRRAGLGWRKDRRRPGRAPPGVRPLMHRKLFAFFAALCLSAVASAQPPDADRVVFPVSVPQGAMVIGKVPPGSHVEYRGRILRTTGYGTVVFGVGRDEPGPAVITVTRPDGSRETVRVAVTPRDWPVQRVDGVPPATVDPPPAIAERIRREQARVADARRRDDPRADFAQRFIMPVQGRISGRFG